MKLIGKKRRQREESRRQVREELAYEFGPDDLGDIEFNKRRAEALRKQALRRNG